MADVGFKDIRFPKLPVGISTELRDYLIELERRLKDEVLRPVAIEETGAVGITDHGGLTGLSDDDHTQYHNDARGDARYIEKDGSTADVSADIPFNSHKLTGVTDPASAQDAATKNYVDSNFAADDHTHTEEDITDLSHVDPTAIHDDAAGEINAITEKETPAGTDLLLIEDSAASNAKKKIQIGNLPTGVAGNYTELLQEITPSTTTSWISKNLSGYGVSAGNVVEILLDATNGTFGVMGTRASGSSIERSTYLPTESNLTMHVKAAGENATIEVRTYHATYGIVKVIGYWS